MLQGGKGGRGVRTSSFLPGCKGGRREITFSLLQEDKGVMWEKSSSLRQGCKGGRRERTLSLLQLCKVDRLKIRREVRALGERTLFRETRVGGRRELFHCFREAR